SLGTSRSARRYLLATCRVRIQDFLSPFKHSLMKVLRSSPLRDFVFASALHFFIFSCWVMGAAGEPAFKHCEMNALRSSPFLSPASALHGFIFSCCGVSFFSSAARTVTQVPVRSATAESHARSVFMNASWKECVGSSNGRSP